MLWRTKRQRGVRLLAHEILVGRDSITMPHSIPMPTLTPDSHDSARPTHDCRSPGPAMLSFALTHSTRQGHVHGRFTPYQNTRRAPTWIWRAGFAELTAP